MSDGFKDWRPDGLMSPAGSMPAGRYVLIRVVLLVLAVVALVLGAVLDVTALALLAAACLVATGALDVQRRWRGGAVPSPVTVIALALIMGVPALVDWPLSASAWVYVALCAVAVVLALASSDRRA